MASIKEILNFTRNRQYPLPQRKWKFYQEWHKTLFFHWEVPVSFLEQYIPEDLELDTYQNRAWISHVSFEVKDMRIRNLPPFPYVSNFEEINIRTYVIKDGIPGIFMLSIETNKLIEVLLTRTFMGLPYQKAIIKRQKNQLFSRSKKLDHHLAIKIGKSTSLRKKTELDIWLTERLSLYDVCNKKICRFDIHHMEWNLTDPQVTINEIRYETEKYSLHTYPDKIHYADKIQVLLWGKIRA